MMLIWVTSMQRKNAYLPPVQSVLAVGVVLMGGADGEELLQFSTTKQETMRSQGWC